MSTNSSVLDYASRDFLSISKDLIAAIPNLTQDWNPESEVDPGMVFIKLASSLGDMLSYNRDMAAMEMFPDTVRQRQDAYKIFNSLGYKMKGFRSAIVYATMTTALGANKVFMPKFTGFRTKQTNIPFVYLGDRITIASSTSAGDLSTVTRVPLFQGVGITPPLVGTSRITSDSDWHSVYTYNFYTKNLTESLCFTLSKENVAQGSVILIDDQNNEWTETTNAQAEAGRFFEVVYSGVGNPYVKLSKDPSEYGINAFKVFYVATDGWSGRVSAGSMSNTPTTSLYTFDGSSFKAVDAKLSITNTASVGGFNAETIEEARYNFNKTKGDLNTLVTLQDFENYTKSITGVKACKAEDSTYQNICLHAQLLARTINSANYQDNLAIPDGYQVNPASVRLYCNNTLIAAGISGYDSTNDWYNMRTVVNNISVNAIVQLNGYIQWNMSSFPDGASFGYVWATYRFYTPKRCVFENIVPYSGYDVDLLTETILESVEEREHIELTCQASTEYNVNYEWKPKGVITLKNKVSQSVAQAIMEDVHQALTNKYNMANTSYSSAIDYYELTQAIMGANSTINYAYVQPIEYSLVMKKSINLADNNGILNYSATGCKILDHDAVRGTVKQSGTLTLEYDDRVQKLVGTITIPQEFCIIPGTLELVLGGGKCKITEDLGEIIIPSTPGTSSATPQLASGALRCNNGQAENPCGFVYYDSIYEEAVSTGELDDNGEEIFNSLSYNIKFNLVTTGMFSANEQVKYMLSYNIYNNGVIKYQGADEASFFIDPLYIQT